MIFPWSKFRNMLTVLGGFTAAILAAWIAGNRKGRRTAREEDERESERVIHMISEKHYDIDKEIQKLPASGRQKVVDADPHTAAGKLRNDGWTGNQAGDMHRLEADNRSRECKYS